jgi:hypothetical protein
MRSFLVGIFLLSMCGPASGQVAGFVEKIGFGKNYRPYGWTPMLVNLTSQIGEPAEYQIQVRQEDLDRDRVVFQRDIVLNPKKQEQFWVYFLAQPRGLGEGTPAELRQLLDVRVCTKQGKPLVKLEIADQIENLDPGRAGFGAQRGSKLVLFVMDAAGGGSTPALREYEGAIGLNEDVKPVRVTPFDLPENAIGYDAVDAVVWLDAKSGDMTSGGSRRLAALTDYVRSGGRLAVCQPVELYKLEEMLDLLPVQGKSPDGDWLIELRDKKDLHPIRDLARFHNHDEQNPAVDLLLRKQAGLWDALEKAGPFKVAYARLRDDAVGEEWIDWSGDGKQRSPWLARRALGFGSVTWVAQDLGNPKITTRGATGWPYVWDRVLGMRNSDMRVDEETRGKEKYAEDARQRYFASNAVDLGGAFLRGMEHEGRAGGLIFLAGVFFVGYWVVAGPVSYLVLLGKKRTELSWSIFAVSALAATLLTVGVVRLVLRGDAEVHHISLVRMTPAGTTDDGKPVSRAIVSSRIGLYIPRSGDQAVKLLGNDEAGLSYVTPFSVHPAHYDMSSEFPAYLTYTVPVRDNPLTDPVSVAFPYRRTLKKIQARWEGRLEQSIDVASGGRNGTAEENRPRLVPREKGTISGKLVNRTGANLTHVYLAFNFPPSPDVPADEDIVLYLPSWSDGETIDLGSKYNTESAYLTPPGVQATPRNAIPGGNNKKPIRALSIDHWTYFWYSGIKTGVTSDRFDDSRNEFLRSFPMVSLYDRITPQFNRENIGNNTERFEVLRRAARAWDMSESVAAGQLVVLALRGVPGALDQSPLPFGMEVEGDPVIGTGTTFYQCPLPLDHAALPPPWAKEEDAAATTTTAPASDDAAPKVER